MRKSFVSIASYVGIIVAAAAGPAAASASTAPAAAAPPANLEITQKVYFDIKIANYTEESTGRNQGAAGSGRIVIGLYGKAAPERYVRTHAFT